MFIKSYLRTFVGRSHFVKKKHIINDHHHNIGFHLQIIIISAFVDCSCCIPLSNTCVASEFELQPKTQNIGKIWNHYHQDLLLNMKVVIIEIVIGICSGNSSECRLEVSATKLADHGTWTCSLSQDKVGILRVMVMMIGLVTIQGHGYQNMMSGPKRRSQPRL